MTATQKLVATLDSITGTGKFTSQGGSSFFFPGIQVYGEEIGFPLSQSQVKHFISLAEPAPYGKGEETVFDHSVRKSWQIDACHIRFPKKGKWKKYLKDISDGLAEDMGIREPFILAPYKLLIYEQGGHFLPHTDTEKIPHMFGSLVIALPSTHSGGELLIRHAGEEVTAHFGEFKNNNFQHICFFSDCEHEVKPVTGGYRVCLTYNIAFKKKPKIALNQSFHVMVPKLRQILEDLKPELNEAETPLRAILLNHQYTEEHFTLSALKNEDFSKAKALMAAAKQAGYHAHLGLVTLYQMGELECDYDDDDYYGHGRGRRHRLDLDTGRMGEIYEEDLSIDDWRKGNDRPVKLGKFGIKPSVFIPETDLKAGEPDEEESEGYTGNAGCTMEYWYHKAAVILWPKDDLNRVLCHYNLKGAAQTFLEYKKNRLSRNAAESLGLAIIKSLSSQRDSERYRILPIDDTVAGICELKSSEMLKDCLKSFSPDILSVINERTWKNLFKIFDRSYFTSYFELLSEEAVAKNAEIFIPPLQAVLKSKKSSTLTEVLANKFLQHQFSQVCIYDRNQVITTIDHDILHLMLASSAYISNLAKRKNLRSLLEYDMSLNYIREKLGKALLAKKYARHFNQPDSLQPAILQKAVSILEKEMSRSITAYPDWARPYVEVGQMRRNADDFFIQLKIFCLNPDLDVFDLRARAEIRESIEAHICSCQLDFDCQTIKQGTPHTLRLTKNSNSYHRALKTRKNDISLLKNLTVMSS